MTILQLQPYSAILLDRCRSLEMGNKNHDGKSSMAKVATCVVVVLFFVSAAGQDLAADTRALITFRNVFDPRGTKLNWTNTTSTCRWNGVVCSRDRVTQIRLPGDGLTGIIPPESLSLLSELRVVSLRNNHLTGPFPGELGNCNHVHALYLGGNDFYGPVPNLTGFWPRLTHLSLEYNRSGHVSFFFCISVFNSGFSRNYKIRYLIANAVYDINCYLSPSASSLEYPRK